jgi:hypothetical protein
MEKGTDFEEYKASLLNLQVGVAVKKLDQWGWISHKSDGYIKKLWW